MANLPRTKQTNDAGYYYINVDFRMGMEGKHKLDKKCKIAFMSNYLDTIM